MKTTLEILGVDREAQNLSEIDQSSLSIAIELPEVVG
jgi:hypothetical protein